MLPEMGQHTVAADGRCQSEGARATLGGGHHPWELALTRDLPGHQSEGLWHSRLCKFLL